MSTTTATSTTRTTTTTSTKTTTTSTTGSLHADGPLCLLLLPHLIQVLQELPLLEQRLLLLLDHYMQMVGSCCLLMILPCYILIRNIGHVHLLLNAQIDHGSVEKSENDKRMVVDHWSSQGICADMNKRSHIWTSLSTSDQLMARWWRHNLVLKYS